MAVYYINAYDIIDAEDFSLYPPKVMALLKKYGAEVIAIDAQPIVLEGAAKMMNAIIRFPTEESALECYHSDEYCDLKAIRLRSTTNCTMILVKEFLP